jgi:pre-mRNA-splicing factor 18
MKKKEEEREAARKAKNPNQVNEEQVSSSDEIILHVFQSSISESKPSGSSVQIADSSVELPRAEVVKRLRIRGAPILLFGETHKEAQKRLRKLEIEQPELKEGWTNEFQNALNKVDEELVDEVIKGVNRDQQGKNDVKMPEAEKTWDQITVGLIRFPFNSMFQVDAFQLERTREPVRDCEIIHSFIVHILKRWGNDLNARDEEVKRSPFGKLESGTHKQTMENLKPLVNQLKAHTCNNDIRGHLCHIVRLCVIERDYVQANTAYMEMAIGNAPWPIGVTRSGVHQRPGSAKAYVSNIAHVLNDETQRKYIHGLKRIITKCQDYYATDPSKCVEYVKKKV